MKFALWLPVAVMLASATPTTSSFAPLDAWKRAVLSGDGKAFTSLYLADPRRTLLVDKQPISLEQETAFWTSLHAAGVTVFNPKVLSLEGKPDQVRLILRLQGQLKDGRKFVASMSQFWIERNGQWAIAASQRSEIGLDAGRRLPEPEKPNPNLYADPADGQRELTEAEKRAAPGHKRVLVVFGANWCYDCHVLDATLRSAQFVPLVTPNFVVVHISIGDEGKDNNDLAKRLGVNLDKGVPSLAVLTADGKVITAQQNGEFESTIRIGPEDIRAFLEKWKAH
jgi:hypothetical protein